MRTPKKRSITIFLCILMMAGAVQAQFAVTNGDFETGAGAGVSIADVNSWYDNSTANFWEDAWQTNAPGVTPDDTDVVVFCSWDTVQPDPNTGPHYLTGSYLYQGIGTANGESSIWVSFDWGHPDDVAPGRHDGITVSVLDSNGTFVPNDANDILGAPGVTVLDSASYDHVAAGTDGEIWPVVVKLDLSGAKVGDEIFLRFNNYMPEAGADPWPVLDNVKITKKPPTIAWVTDTIDVDSNGVQDDQSWIDMLTNAGYIVNVQPDRYAKIGDEKDANDANDYIGELNAADLVIISRSSSSGTYASDANEIKAWNSIQTPLICLSAYHVRSNRLGWVNSSSAVSDNSLPFMSVVDANSPIFDGVDTSSGMVDMVNTLIYGDGYQGTTFVDTTDMGNATVLGSYLLGYPWIAVWQPGVEFYDGAGQVAGGERMMFLAGTQETKSNGIYYPQGAMNLTPDGQKVFLNAVAYMLQFKPEDPGTANLTHQYTFEDGTAADIVGDANGTLFGASYIADGSFVTTDQNDYLSLPGEVIDINSYSEVTLECWYTPEVNANPGWSMLASFGNTMSGWKGVDYLFITTARADDISRAAISCLNYSAPWGAENGVNGPEYDDGMLHHMVATVDANEISFYIDGQAMGSTPLDPNNTLSNLSNAEAYLAKSVYGDPQWIGSIQKFSIYDAALSPQEVLYLYLQGD